MDQTATPLADGVGNSHYTTQSRLKNNGDQGAVPSKFGPPHLVSSEANLFKKDKETCVHSPESPISVEDAKEISILSFAEGDMGNPFEWSTVSVTIL